MTEPVKSSVPYQSDMHSDACAKFLVDGMAKRGIDAVVSSLPPLVAGPYTKPGFVCPHGTSYWMEPTGEQIAQWAKDGVT